jgi:hypothetical protein
MTSGTEHSLKRATVGFLGSTVLTASLMVLLSTLGG